MTDPQTPGEKPDIDDVVERANAGLADAEAAGRAATEPQATARDATSNAPRDAAGTADPSGDREGTVTAESASSEPLSSEPVTSEPVSSESGSPAPFDPPSEPTTPGEPPAAPTPVEPPTTPEPSEPGLPNAPEPGAPDAPEPLAPNPVEPNPVEPNPVEPNPVEPVEPNPAEPNPAQPAEPMAAEPMASDSEPEPAVTTPAAHDEPIVVAPVETTATTVMPGVPAETTVLPSDGETVAVAGAAGAAGAATAGGAGAAATEPAGLTAIAGPRPVYVAAPEPPTPRGNRGAAGLIGLVAAVAFAVLYLGAWTLVDLAKGSFDAANFGNRIVDRLSTLDVWTPTVVFFLGFWLLGACINRARWAYWVIFGILVGAAAYIGHIAGQLAHAQAWNLSYAASEKLVRGELFAPLAIAAFVIGRELTIWFGAWVAARGRKVTAQNLAAQEEYERSLDAGPHAAADRVQPVAEAEGTAAQREPVVAER